MNQPIHAPGYKLRLLVPETDCTAHDTPRIELCDRMWIIAEFAQTAETPEYTCLSYSWGKGREENSLCQGYLISDRTIPALEAAIKASHPQAIWVDALCVPTEDPDRTQCLQNMGAIYGAAKQVFAVLSEPCLAIFQQIRDQGRLDPDAMFCLENDEWVNRAWTYQETVNSHSLSLIAQGDDGSPVSGMEFLEAVLDATTNYQKVHQIDRFLWLNQHPRLHTLEDLMADYRNAEYLERSAYQVMSAIYRRYAERAEDYFYAMVGAITTAALNGSADPSLPPAEYFMQICESKNDYSYIYCIAPRSKDPGRRWRPVVGPLPPVLASLSVSGSGQAGSLKPTHLQLDDVCRITPGTLTSVGLKGINAFLAPTDATPLSPGGRAEAILERLRLLGFSGCGDYMELPDGYFFPQSKITPQE